MVDNDEQVEIITRIYKEKRRNNAQEEVRFHATSRINLPAMESCLHAVSAYDSFDHEPYGRKCNSDIFTDGMARGHIV